MTTTKIAKVLLVEDEEQLLRVLGSTLAAAGYATTLAKTGAEAIACIANETFDVILLDLGLPDLDGKDVITQARATTRAPILVLSARASENEKIAALDRGANDYVAKPFGVGELLARVRVAVRPPFGAGAPGNYSSKNIEIDFRSRIAVVEGATKRLTARETELLRALADANGDIVSHEELVTRIWGVSGDADVMHLRVLAWQVRRKIEPDAAAPRYLISEQGLGYRLSA
ncbi:MAG: response regulator transcription factor [Phenylobacterium sp.]|uniref:response regulator transcription factor n=1 Tax=Phenylobacterium sp. TaxID=1871053 RepID=UPI0027338117|nr:response regulator transcription factor [Phenylobacterium sp.]MDP3175223.1 response regulator transcription factor [Phenylobacterium sp.]